MKLLKRLWANEPVLVGTAVSLLTTLGILSADQASAVTNAVAGAAAVVAQLVAAFTVRSVVTSPATVAKASEPKA